MLSYCLCYNEEKMITFMAIAVGGAIGSMLRVLLSTLLPSSAAGIPIPILLINIIGSFLIGVLIEINILSQTAKYFLVSGFLGGFTTFSTFALESNILLQQEKFLLSLVYVVLSITLSIIACWIGMKIMST